MSLHRKVKYRVLAVLKAQKTTFSKIAVDKAVNTALKGLTKYEWLMGQLYNEEMCEACGGCCTESPIRLEHEDIKYLTSFLSLPTERFHAKYVTLKNGIMYLMPPCPFLKGEKCIVYVARPLMCRMYPFNQNIETATFPKNCVFPEKLYALRALNLLSKEKDKPDEALCSC